MLKKTLKKAIAFTLAGAMMFSGAAIAGPADTDVASASTGNNTDYTVRVAAGIATEYTFDSDSADWTGTDLLSLSKNAPAGLTLAVGGNELSVAEGTAAATAGKAAITLTTTKNFAAGEYTVVVRDHTYKDTVDDDAAAQKTDDGKKVTFRIIAENALTASQSALAGNSAGANLVGNVVVDNLTKDDAYVFDSDATKAANGSETVAAAGAKDDDKIVLVNTSASDPGHSGGVVVDNDGKFTIAAAKVIVGANVKTGTYKAVFIRTAAGATTATKAAIVVDINVKAKIAATGTLTANVYPGSGAKFSAKNVTAKASGDPFTVEYTGDCSAIVGDNTENKTDVKVAETNQNDPTAAFKLAFEGSASDRNVTITPVPGYCVPGEYTFEFIDALGTTGEVYTLNVLPFEAGSSTTLDLGIGATASIFFNAVNASQGFDKDTSYAVSPASNMATITASALNTNFIRVDYKVTGAVGGNETYSIKGDGSKTSTVFGRFTANVATKAAIEGISSTATVAIGKKINLATLATGDTVDTPKAKYDTTKIVVKDKTGAVVNNTGAGTNKVLFTVSSSPSGFIAEDDGTEFGWKECPIVTGKVGGTTVVTVKAYKDNLVAPGNLVAEAKCTLTVLGASAISVADEKGTALSGDAPLALDLLKNTSKKVVVTAPTGTTPTFKSANEKVATVAADGTVTAVGEGRTTITVSTAATATVAAASTTFDVVVTKKPNNTLTVTDDKGVALSNILVNGVNAYDKEKHTALKLNLKDRQSAKISVAEEDSSAALTFTTTATAFTVDKFTGEVKVKDALTTGSGVITVAAAETTGYNAAVYNVQVIINEKPDDEITTDADTFTVVAGKTVAINAKSKANATLTYSSADSAVAAVDAAGVITGVKAGGPVKITITAAETANTVATSKTVTVTVKKYADNTITVKKEDGSEVGDQLDITAATKVTISAKGNPKITVTAKNADIVNFELADGVYTFTPNKPGSAVFEITSAEVETAPNFYVATTRYLVVNYGKVEGTVTADESVSAEVGGTAQITASASNGNPVSFESIDPSVATVDASGVVTGVKEGSTVVMVSATECKTALVKVIITAKKNNTKKKNTMTVKAKAITAKYGKKTVVKKSKAFTVKNAKGSVTFKKSSGNKKISVTKAGKVTIKKGLKKGTYKVKVSVKAAGNSTYKALTKKVTLKVTVK